MNKIHVIGDSHVLRFKDNLFIPYEITYATAYNLIEEESKSQSRKKIFEILKKIDKKERIALMFGEIDCRVHLHRQSFYYSYWFTGVQECVDRYFEFIFEVWNKGYHNLFIFGPVASTPFHVDNSEFPTNGSVKERNQATWLFNKFLEEKCNQYNITFVSIYNDLLKEQFLPDEKYYQNDKIHIIPEYQVEFFKNKLWEKLIPFKYGGRNRKVSFNKVLNYIDNINNPIMVEIGQTRNYYNWNGDGYSTPLFSWYMNQRKNGQFFSVDISDNSKVYDGVFGIWGIKRDGIEHGVHIIQSDGIEFLKKFNNQIDFLYLDAWDYHKSDESIQTISETMHLEAFKIAEPKLKKGSLILIDDILDQKTFVGKGRLLIPYMIENGYEVIHKGYQFLFKKVR